MAEESNALDVHACYHCGDNCDGKILTFDQKEFCCQGCVSVFKILNQNELADYYCLNEAPGVKMDAPIQSEKFKFLEIESIVQQIIKFKNKDQTQVVLYLPQIHCSSCLWLLEHLSELNAAIIGSQVNFTSKMITISFNHHEMNIRSLVELLASLGYEPLIDIQQPEQTRLETRYNSKTSYLKIGIAGFCFSNIMLISFPEYLGLDTKTNPYLLDFFKWTNLILSLPVIFYSAREFFENAYYSFKQRYLNIDVPIAIAILVTFIRSVYEVVSNTGVGFFDSMTGIVFFMLLGRTLQNRTYSTLSFNKDYQSYFPLAVTKIIDKNHAVVKVQEIEEHDLLFIHKHEVIPTDCILSKGDAAIDYSYITGEALPEKIAIGDIVYAGGKNVGEALEVLVVKPFSDNSFTKLWNNNAFEKQQFEKEAMTTVISKYFSLVVLIISLSTFTYWMFMGASFIAWRAGTAVLIIACPCALLLTASFTNGYLLDLLAKHGIFYKNAQVIEKMAKCKQIAFDKTGTITAVNTKGIVVVQNDLSQEEQSLVLSAMTQSSHPLSVSIVRHFDAKGITVDGLQVEEIKGKGLAFEYQGVLWKIGSRNFIQDVINKSAIAEVLVSADGVLKAVFGMHVQLKEGIATMMDDLAISMQLSLISGDNDGAMSQMQELFPKGSDLKFNCSPEDKLHHIAAMQESGEIVMMVGDGLNDAGALKQSDIGMTVVKNTFSFSPACDVIIEEAQLPFLHQLIKVNKATQRLIWLGFTYSLIFNVIGIAIAIQGALSPLTAAILMPSSSLGIIFISYLGIKFIKNKYFKSVQSHNIAKTDKNHVLA